MKRCASPLLLLPLAALMVALHAPYLTLPFHWDELGQFVPAALDLHRDGAWVSHSTLPNVHPPGVMAILALVWRITGYSIVSARLVMLAIATLGVFLSYRLALRLSRGNGAAPALAAALFLIATPSFYTQSMMVLLDMPAMTLTVLVLLLFLGERPGWSAVAATALVLVKETAITTPLVLALWLWLRDRRRREALCFAAPVVALGIWLMVLHRVTGHWLGNAEFAHDNVTAALTPLHLLAAVLRTGWLLFVASGKFVGSLALLVGWRRLRGREWSVALSMGAAQVVLVTLLGGAILERYLLPVLPILFAAMAVAACAYPPRWRHTSYALMTALLVAGWFWRSPLPTELEGNLAMVDFVRLQQDAARHLESHAPAARVASVWPFTGAISRPEFGYVHRPVPSVVLRSFDVADLARANRRDYDLLVVYSRSWSLASVLDEIAVLRPLLRRRLYTPEPSADEIRASLGLVPLERWQRGWQWIAIYGPAR